jgi:hypothetical protein
MRDPTLGVNNYSSIKTTQVIQPGATLFDSFAPYSWAPAARSSRAQFRFCDFLGSIAGRK